MLTRNENGVLQLDGDAFLAALDEGVNELKRAEELLSHATELSYLPANLPKWQEVFTDDARKMEWELALRVRKGRDGTWRIHGQANVAWNGERDGEGNWAPHWAGIVYATLEDALEDVPAALAAHTEQVEHYLTLCQQRMTRLDDKQAADQGDGYAALAAAQDEEDDAFHAAMRTRRRDRADGDDG